MNGNKLERDLARFGREKPAVWLDPRSLIVHIATRIAKNKDKLKVRKTKYHINNKRKASITIKKRTGKESSVARWDAVVEVEKLNKAANSN